MRFLFALLLLLTTPAFAQDAPPAQSPQPQHAVALHGTPKYAPDFAHVDFVNPDAPKGGTIRSHVIGTFDSLNPFIIKGTPAAGMNFLRSGMVYQSLMQNAWDEPFTLYGVLAENIEIPEDRSWVAFNLRPQARWNDGQPVTAEDVVWSFNTLTEKGSPFFKAYWHDVTKVTAENERRVKFDFGVKGNAELPLIIAEMAILPKHYWADKTFEETSLAAPLGSGPYKVETIDPGRSITYTRIDDWWGKDLPFFKGMYNFDRIQYDYYRDDNVALEAFFAGEYDVRMENTAKLWVQSYDAPPVKDGRITKAEIENSRPAGMQAFVYNIRRPVFQDPKVREALAYAFDFEWSNKQFAFGTYTRTDSYFENSELASTGLPSEEELTLLEPFRDQIPPEVFTKTYAPPLSDGSGNNRANLRTAMKILDEAGWVLGKDGIRAKDGVRLEFEILDSNPVFERWVLPFLKNLERIGVKANFRVVDTAQYQNRMNDFDYDMTISVFGQSDSPGNEQRDFWGSEKADLQGSRNYIGIKDPVIDSFIDKIIHATSREDLVTKTRAMDRILLWNHYVIPMWHYPKWRIAYWNKIQRPETLSGISPLITDTWWSTQE
ncbi:MAG: ABC transporter substrate-binding protein [Alphaproteobacteria bacterium]|nr:ABC transporter substrate-binding protein [Alphaproteobacteria bacterium]